MWLFFTSRGGPGVVGSAPPTPARRCEVHVGLHQWRHHRQQLWVRHGRWNGKGSWVKHSKGSLIKPGKWSLSNLVRGYHSHMWSGCGGLFQGLGKTLQCITLVWTALRQSPSGVCVCVSVYGGGCKGRLAINVACIATCYAATKSNNFGWDVAWVELLLIHVSHARRAVGKCWPSVGVAAQC